MRYRTIVAITVVGACSGSGGEPHPLCNEPGYACTWLGIGGQEGFNGDGRDRLATKIYWSMDLEFAADGTPWFIDWNNHLVRKVRSDDTIETVLGWTDPVFPGDGAPDERTPGGALGTDVQLNHPTDLATLPDGTLLVMAWHNHKLRKLDPLTGRVSIVCGADAGFTGDGGPASRALFRQPKSLELDAQSNMYILDQGNLRVRRIDASGVITTIAGNGMQGFGGDGGPATAATFGFETGSNPEPSGGLAIAGGKLYIADTLNHRIRVIDLATNVITTLAGTGVKGFGGDGGPASQAQLANPRDLEIGPDNQLYVADTDNHRIRAIDLTTNAITTVAGTGVPGLDEGDPRLATETALARPFAIEFDAEGHMYISDTLNSRFVKVRR